MKKLLVIAECINKDSTSEGIGTCSFLNALAEGNYQIDCVFFQYVQHELEEHTHISERVNLIKIRNTWVDHLIQWARPVRNRLNKHLGYDLLRNRRSFRFKKVLNKLLNDKEYHLIFVRTIASSLASHKAVLELSKMRDFNWIVNFNDPAPSSMMPYPYNLKLQSFSRKNRRDEILVRNIVKAASGIASPSLLLTERFLNFTAINKDPERLFRFPHVYENLQTTAGKSFLNPSKFNLVHAGSLLEERTPRYLLMAIDELAEEDSLFRDRSKLTFFGSLHQSHQKDFDSFSHREILDLHNNRIPHQDALNVLRDSDILIILEAISDDSPFMPSKLAEFIGMDKCILALSPPLSETRRILGSDYEFQTEADNVQQIKELIKYLFKEWENKRSLTLNSPLLQKYVSPSHVIKEIDRALKIFARDETILINK